MGIKLLGSFLVAALVATPALARDRVGHEAIASGDLAKAERTLVAERRIFPNRPELMLNLASVYDRTGRATDARALYGSVIARDAVMLDMSDGTVVSSHDVAKAAMARASGARASGNQIVSR